MEKLREAVVPRQAWRRRAETKLLVTRGDSEWLNQYSVLVGANPRVAKKDLVHLPPHLALVQRVEWVCLKEVPAS